MRLGLSLVAAALLAAVAAPALAANAVQNGDFEEGDNGPTNFFSTSTSHYYPYSSAPNFGLVVPTGYTSLSVELLGGNGEADNNYLHVTATSGFAGIYQTLQPGIRYVSADIKSLDGNVAGIQLFQGNYAVGGYFSGTDTDDDGWQHVVFDLTSLAGDPSGSELRITSFYGPADFLVDNIYAAAAAPVPEPGEWAMIAAGLGVVGAVARRRHRRD